ncbi:MAG: HEPN domain-containing protein [Oligoflexia bacterium]|nr:HEPN domain-containing protein [Oligoflexia bacterium]
MTPKQERLYKPEYALELLRIAEGDLGSALALYKAEVQSIRTPTGNETMLDYGRPDNVCYHSQQCVEKLVKAVLCFLKIPVPLSHDLDLLISKIPNQHGFPIDYSLSELSLFASIRRYEEGTMILSDEDLIASINIAKQVLMWAKSIIKK